MALYESYDNNSFTHGYQMLLELTLYIYNNKLTHAQYNALCRILSNSRLGSTMEYLRYGELSRIGAL